MPFRPVPVQNIIQTTYAQWNTIKTFVKKQGLNLVTSLH